MRYFTWSLFLSALLAGCTEPGWRQASTGAAHEITFAFEDAVAQTVELAGSFNNWIPVSTPLQKTDADRWSTTVHLQKGAHQYMFVIDGKKWLPDPHAAQTVPDGFGRMNSLVIIE